MAQPVPLDNFEHRDLKIITRHAAELGDIINQALVVPTEYGDLQREYPIFFRLNSEGGFESFVLLGLDKDENLYLDEDRWNARYVPAILTRGPFLIGFGPDEGGGESRRDLVVNVDLDHPRISRSEGEPLFLTHGGNAPALERATQALRVIHAGAEMSGSMFDAFYAAGLIAPVEIDIRIDDSMHYKLPELFSISADALAGMDAATLKTLHEKGYLALALHVVSSMGNLRHMINLKARRRADRGHGHPHA
ncbi:SapC family protein [Asticcacaulis sp. AC402]|uniref:SapC family protein n=1 Tax=Asticcacaulis sp. AC402 TaxID=1282361 RepID=UPI0003C3C8F7|nr:SapC family protein [Asticcacaulis sp. AC402]ESQ73670.1 hypothetical protein ABAC402_18155 [Asticcacaulis sp. AC402]